MTLFIPFLNVHNFLSHPQSSSKRYIFYGGRKYEELAFLETLLKRNNKKISVLVYGKPTHTDLYLYYSSHHQASWNKSVVCSFFSRVYSIITNIDHLTYNNSLSQSQQQIQATDIQEEEIRMSLNLPHVEGTSEKLRHILRSHKVISTLYTESTLRKLLCKLKNQVTAE